MLHKATFVQAKRLALLVWVGGCSTLFCQVPPAEIADQTQPGTIPDLGPSLLRLRQNAEVGTIEPVQRAPEPDLLTVYTSQTYYHLDNMFLTAANRQEANVWVGALGVSIVPYSTYRWTPRFTVEGALVRHDGVSVVDYNMQSIRFANRVGLTDDNLLSWDFGVSARRAESDRGLGEFFKFIEVGSDLNWFRQIDRNGHWVFHASPGVKWWSAHPSWEDRLDAGAVVSVLWLAHRKFAGEPFFEVGYAYYPNDAPTLLNRRDVHLRSGVNLLWQISRHASVVASAYWWGNYSSTAGADYQVLPNVTLHASIGF
jgi:hypothetical protein